MTYKPRSRDKGILPVTGGRKVSDPALRDGWTAEREKPTFLCL